MQGISSGGIMNKFELSLESHTSEHYSPIKVRKAAYDQLVMDFATMEHLKDEEIQKERKEFVAERVALEDELKAEKLESMTKLKILEDEIGKNKDVGEKWLAK
jgi:hypothetical protein